MKHNEIKCVLMDRDGLTEKEANLRLAEIRKKIFINGEDPSEFLLEELGLESDYLFDQF